MTNFSLHSFILAILLLLATVNASVVEERWRSPWQQYQQCNDLLQNQQAFCRAFLRSDLPPQSTVTTSTTTTTTAPAQTSTVPTTVTTITTSTNFRTSTSTTSVTATTESTTTVTETSTSSVPATTGPAAPGPTPPTGGPPAGGPPTIPGNGGGGRPRPGAKRSLDGTLAAPLEARGRRIRQQMKQFDPEVVSKACFNILYHSTTRPATTTTITSTSKFIHEKILPIFSNF